MFFRAFLVLLLVFFAGLNAFAEERITSFDVVVEVQKNGDFIVTETIAVEVEGNEIRRGIFRDIPRFLQDGNSKVPQKFDINLVERNGSAEKHEVSKEDNALRIRIGNPNKMLPHGKHTYTIKYRAKNQIRYDENYDEVYWNVTGNYWNFPIEAASAKITFPDDINIVNAKAYMGSLGSKGGGYNYRAESNEHNFITTQRLNRREGITVSLKFDKGVIDPPSASDRRFMWWVKNGALLILSTSLFGILGYYYRSWNKVGRDPVKDPVFPRYEAPQGYSPAAVSHIHYKGFSGHKALIASLVSLAMADRIKIDPEKKKTVLSTTDQANDNELPQEQSLLLRKLFSSRKRSITLDRTPNTKFNSVHTVFIKDVTDRYSKDYYRRNLGYMAIGLAISALALIAAGVASFGPWKQFYFYIFGALILTNVLFFYLLPAPTDKGQKLMSEIKGFKLYLETAEKLQLNAYKVGQAAPPMMTLERYEKFLPYAIALGVEKPWSKHFQSSLPEAAKNYSPHWTSSNFNAGSIDRNLKSMVSNMSSGVSSAAPQSSGSSGGGGFSGGGGGGGGGGGW